MASNIAKGAIISYISIFINILISFVYTPWMIHLIGPSDYGLYSLVLAFVSYFLLDFGLNTSITRFIAKYRAEGEEQKVANLLGLTTRVYLIIDSVIFIVLCISYFFLEHIFSGLTQEEIETLRGLYIIAGLFSVLTFAVKPIDGAMMAFEYFVPNKVLEMVYRVGSVILIVVLLSLGGDVYSLILVHCGTAFFSSLCKYIFFVKKSKLHINWRFFDKDLLKVLMSFSGWVFLIGMAQRFRLSFIPTVLGIQSNSTEIAVFSLGITIEGFVWTISSALNGLFLPKVTRILQTSTDKQSLLGLMTRVGRIQFYIMLLIFTCFLFFGKPFVKCWVGDIFTDTYYIILLLIAPSLILTTQSIASDAIYAENKVKYTSSMIFTTSILGLLGSFIVAPYFGAVGCAVCSCIGLLSYIFLVNILYKRKLGLDILFFFRNCHLDILLRMMISVMSGFLLSYFIPIDNWISLILVAIFYVFIFAVNSYFISLNIDEKKLILSFFKR